MAIDQKKSSTNEDEIVDIVNDDEKANKCRELRNNGPFDMTAPGFCAAFGIANAERFEKFA